MPGATRTNFMEASNSSKALVWRVSLLTMEADEVAGQSVEAMLRGDRLVVPGWPNKLYVHVLSPLVSPPCPTPNSPRCRLLPHCANPDANFLIVNIPRSLDFMTSSSPRGQMGGWRSPCSSVGCV
ncbi:unnamed protein product [Choristocarpus tenellus]